MSGKYKVPTMAEIEALPKNGYKVVSTFSGGGGSCLGYKMAGYEVVFASEFVEETQRTYRINFPRTYLDTRDIRELKPEEIFKITGLKKGELDLFDGSPPCCAFSTAGVVEKGWGEVRKYSEGKKQRIDDLFFEYARILNGLQPKVFIAENVSGLVKGKAKGYFKLILSELKKCGYQVKAALINAAMLGVPQSRERIIFCGVREDIGLQPVYPKPLKERFTIREAFVGLVQDEEERQQRLDEVVKKTTLNKRVALLPKCPPKRLDFATYTKTSTGFNLVRESWRNPSGTILQANGILGISGNIHPEEDRKFTTPELKRLFSLPDDYIVTGNTVQKWERIGRMVPPLLMKAVAENIAREVLDKI